MKKTFTSPVSGLILLMLLSANTEASLLSSDISVYAVNHEVNQISTSFAAYSNGNNSFHLSYIDRAFEFLSDGVVNSGQSNSGNGHGSAMAAISETSMARVPLPTAAWLFASGLVGLVGIARRKTKPEQRRSKKIAA